MAWTFNDGRGEPDEAGEVGGFGVSAMYEDCERLGVWSIFGIGPPRRMCHMNSRFKDENEELVQAIE